MTEILVTDASVVVDLIARFQAKPIEDLIFNPGYILAAPELLDIEVLHTLRRLDSDGRISHRRKSSLLDDLISLRIRRYRHHSLLSDIWRHRRNLTAYDATYVSLARHLKARLVTRDRRLAKAPRLGIGVIVP